MDEEEAAELFSASGAKDAGPISTDALPSIQAEAAIEAAAAAAEFSDFPDAPAAAAEGVIWPVAARRQAAGEQQEAAQTSSIATAAPATAAAAVAQQDPLVTETLEAAQQQRRASLTADPAGNGAPLLHEELPRSSDRNGRQPGDLGPAGTAKMRSTDSNGSQPTALQADEHAQAVQQAQSPTTRSRQSSLDGRGSSQRASGGGRGSAGDRREDSSNSSVHTVQLQQAWPSHPGAAVGRERVCCIASQHQQQPHGRMWD
jgi:hypothetical protein